MKYYESESKRNGITAITHKDIMAVEFRVNDRAIWYDMLQVMNTFTKQNIKEIANQLRTA